MLKLSLKYATKTRPLLSPLLILNHNSIFLSTNPSSFSSSSSSSFYWASSISPFFYSTTQSVPEIDGVNARDVVLSFKEWFECRKIPLLDRIFEILSAQNNDDWASRYAADLALSRLNLRLSESFVLEVLNYGQDVLSRLKFFDWAGRQPGFHHTRATFHAIFKILSKAKLMSLMLDFLENYMEQRYAYRVRFLDTLVMGYAIAGRPEIALQLFGRMRFRGLDLNGFSYHVLLHALVEESCFDAVEVIAKQISMRGFESEITHSIMVRSLCKQNQLDEAEGYLRGLLNDGQVVSGHSVSVLVDALCKSNKFEQAGKLVEEIRELGVVPMDLAYGVWLRDLVQAGKLEGALEFLNSQKSLEGYVPDVFRYNILVSRLLWENRLEEVFDLLMEMQEGQVAPDNITMNAALCFFCKAGMVDVALELFDLRLEFGLSPNAMAYNYLINTLCGNGSVDEAYRVLKNSIDQGYFPGKRTFSILADALCGEGKLDMMKELVIVALEHNFMPTESTYDKFISALCRNGRVEDGYLIHVELNRINKVTTKNTYYNLILGFNKSYRGDIAARLLIEMQEKGHSPIRSLVRSVIGCLCEMENPEKQFLKLLGMQLSRHEPNRQIYNFFIDGAVNAKKPDLAREVFEMMQRTGIGPNLSSYILILQGYLKSEKISDALNFFNDLRQRRKIGRRLYSTMVVGLCKANKVDIALDLLREARANGVVPTIKSYEELIQQLCLSGKYDVAVNLITDMEEAGRHITSFIGSMLLLHSLKTQELFEAWIRLREVQNETSDISLLGQLIGAFSGRIRVSQDIKNLEELIEQCFPLRVYTYNLLVRRLSVSEIDHACELFNQISLKGYKPNRWTYDILIHGLFKHGRTDEAKRLVEEMFRKGLEPTKRIQLLI